MDTNIEEGGVFASQEAIFLKRAFLLAQDELGPEFDLDEAAKSKLAKIVASVAPQADSGWRWDDERRGRCRGGRGVVLEVHRAEGRLTLRVRFARIIGAAPVSMSDQSGVVKTSLDDGSRGLAEIHKAGGLTMVVKPQPGRQGMPENAIAYDGPISEVGDPTANRGGVHGRCVETRDLGSA